MRRLCSGLMFTLLLVGMFTPTFEVLQVEASGTIYIRADGSVDPPTAPIQIDGNLYTLTGDVNVSIIVQKDDIVIDGNGYALQGTVNSIIGIDLTERSSVTVTDMHISIFYYGIFLYYSNDITLTNNILADCRNGIRLWYSDHNVLMSNTVMNNSGFGISLLFSRYNTLSKNEITDSFVAMEMQWGTGNTLRNNIMVGNKYSIDIGHFALSYFLHDIDTSNTINGKPLYYWINRRDQIIPPNAGCIYIINSTGMRAEHLTLTGHVYPLTIAFSTQCSVTDVTATHNMFGVNIEASSHNVVSESNCSNNAEGGFQLCDSSHNLLINNVAINNSGLAIHGAAAGVYLEDTHDEVLMNNVFANNTIGIGTDDSFDIQIIGNDITNNYLTGISLLNCVSCTVKDNNLANNHQGLWLAHDARLNEIYHNNFVYNSGQVGLLPPPSGKSQWDDGYPSGGNYWSDYSGWDANNDGIGDSSYVIDEDERDRYPLMSPYGSPPLSMYTLTIEATDGGTTNPPPGNYRHSKGQNIPVNATPSDCYFFDHWELDSANIGASNPVNVVMNSSTTLRAVFAVPTYGITVRAHCNTEGVDVSVSIKMDGSPTGCTTPNTFMGLTDIHTFAVPDCDAKGHPFKRWSTGQASTNITVSSGGTYTAYYDMKYTLTITSTDGGVTDSAVGTYVFWSGTVASVIAIPDAEYYLDYWQLDGVNIGAPNPVDVTMGANHTLYAVFTQLSSGHDVAVKYMASKTVVGQGYSAEIKVTAVNVGSYAETFNVTVYVNGTPTRSRTVALESGASTTSTFTWDTTGFAKGSYNLSSLAWPVSGEVDTTDNSFTDGWIIVSMVGDLTGGTANPWEFVPDGKVGGIDLTIVAKCFGSWPEAQPPMIWHPNCDIDNDQRVSGVDLTTVAKHLGKTDP